jgi:hypothetical protein
LEVFYRDVLGLMLLSMCLLYASSFGFTVQWPRLRLRLKLSSRVGSPGPFLHAAVRLQGPVQKFSAFLSAV